MTGRCSSLVLILTLICVGIAVVLHLENRERVWRHLERPVEWTQELGRFSNGLISSSSTACGIAMQPADDESIRAWVAVRNCEERETSLGNAYWAIFQMTGGIDTYGWRIKAGTADRRRCEAYFENYSPSNAEIRESLKTLNWQCVR